MIDVAEEQVQSCEALGQTLLDSGPLASADDPRQEIVGENAFGSFLAAVNGKSDAFMQESQIRRLLAAA